jgi:hypothetical protein
VHQGEPAALVIVTATGTAGFRSDGIHVTRSRHLRPNPWASPLTPESPRVCTRWSRRTPAASKNQENQVPEFVRDEEVVGSNPATPTLKMLVRGLLLDFETLFPAVLPTCTDIRATSRMGIGSFGKHLGGKRRRTQEP